MTTVVRTRAELAAALEQVDGPLGLAPTMGALHAGHAALIDATRAMSNAVLVSIFVNPLQFGPTEDLATYPRSLDQDVQLCERHGVDLVWAPSVTDVYPDGDAQVRPDPGPLGEILEGAARPGHFAGMLTVVAKLFGIVRPAIALFGEKDYQQLALIRRMAADLELGVAIAGIPIVRDLDGLALSSRNVHLAADERLQALTLSRALFAARDVAAEGALAVIAAATGVLASEPGIAVDYLELKGADLGEIPQYGPARLLVAAHVGGTRLIDNIGIEL